MQPLLRLAVVIAGLPIITFTLTMIVSDGAPMRPITRGEASGPAVAASALPLTQQERQGDVVAAGYASAAAESTGPTDAALRPEWAELRRLAASGDRDARFLMALLGLPLPVDRSD